MGVVRPLVFGIGAMLVFACGDDSGGDGAGEGAGPTAQPGAPCTAGELLLCQCPIGQGSATCPPGGVVGGDCFCDSQLTGSGGAGGMVDNTGGAMGGGGGGGTGGVVDGAGDPGDPTVSGPEPRIPAAPDSCPNLVTGNVTVRGQQVQLWVGNRRDDVKGSILFYWHGTGSSSNEAQAFGTAIQDITASGGMVASFTTSTGAGQNTANNVWYTGDFEMADDLFACAVQQLNIDTRRVYTTGCSAGGLQAGAMVSGRSSYLAGAMPNSGGIIAFFSPPFEAGPTTPSVITAHGPPNIDPAPGSPAAQQGLTYDNLSSDLTTPVLGRGGFAANCAHSEGHCAAPSAAKDAMWQYLKDHPFGVSPDPYAGGLPGSFPAYCQKLN